MGPVVLDRLEKASTSQSIRTGNIIKTLRVFSYTLLADKFPLMDNKTVAGQVKHLIGQAETEEALRQLIAFLQTDARWSELEQAALETQAQYLNARREAAAGRIGFEQADLIFNRVNNQVLQIAEDLGAGITRSNVGKPVKNRLQPWLAGAAGFVVLAVAGILIFKPGPGPGNAQGADLIPGVCPEFSKKSTFKILLWEFFSFSEDGGASRDIPFALENRLVSIDRERQIETGTYSFIAGGVYPRREEDALKCSTQMAVWGTTEKVAGDRWIIITRYAFADKWQLSKWAMTDNDTWEKAEVTAAIPLAGNFVDTITTISSIFSEGKIAAKIEDLLRIAIGLNATQQQNRDGAIAALENLDMQDSTLALLGGMLLADNYSRAEQPEKARDTYEKVLAVHPNYALALNNYAALCLKEGNPGQAIATLDNALALAPDNPDALAMRGAAFLEINQLDKARRDLTKARAVIEQKAITAEPAAEEQKDRRSKILDRKFLELNTKVEVERKRKAEAESILRQNPTDIDALNTRADASKNLGDYKTAINSANSVIQQQPANLKAHTTLVESFIAIGDTAKVRETLKRAATTGVTSQKIKESAPLIKSLPDSLLLRKRIN